VYPYELCREIRQCLINQIRSDGRLQGKPNRSGYIGYIIPTEEWILGNINQITEAWDDITGKELDPTGVRKAREEEINEYKQHGVYEKGPIEQCWERTDKAPIPVRWIDINKGDKLNPEYRSRLVAKEIKMDNREDLFAATSPS